MWIIISLQMLLQILRISEEYVGHALFFIRFIKFELNYLRSIESFFGLLWSLVFVLHSWSLKTFISFSMILVLLVNNREFPWKWWDKISLHDAKKNLNYSTLKWHEDENWLKQEFSTSGICFVWRRTLSIIREYKLENVMHVSVTSSTWLNW